MYILNRFVFFLVSWFSLVIVFCFFVNNDIFLVVLVYGLSFSIIFKFFNGFFFNIVFLIFFLVGLIIDWILFELIILVKFLLIIFGLGSK